MAFKFERQVGRLIIITIRAPNFSDEIAAFRAQISAQLGRIEAGIGLVDMRGGAFLLPTVAQGYMEIMRADNAKILRSALVVNDDDMFSQQMARLVLEAGNPKRRTFHKPQDAAAWLDVLLSPAEREALSAYLNKLPS